MRARRTLAILWIVTISLLAMPAAANAAQEWGSTKTWPWSGYWWPMFDNGYNLYADNGALDKYDQYVEATTGQAGGAQAWERANHYTNDTNNRWWGHCHAWAAAAILAPEPKAVSRGGVNFNVNDVKGITTSLYYEPTYNWLSGKRVDDANASVDSAAYQDIAPAWMDYLLRYYVGWYKYPFIMDVSANSEVWNYPVFAYRRNSTANADGSESVSTTVWFSSPEWGETGTKYFSKSYTYTLKAGTLGTWTGASYREHPDFAWVPTGKRAGNGTNPYVQERTVETILDLNV